MLQYQKNKRCRVGSDHSGRGADHSLHSLDEDKEKQEQNYSSSSSAAITPLTTDVMAEITTATTMTTSNPPASIKNAPDAMINSFSALFH